MTENHAEDVRVDQREFQFFDRWTNVTGLQRCQPFAFDQFARGQTKKRVGKDLSVQNDDFVHRVRVSNGQMFEKRHCIGFQVDEKVGQRTAEKQTTNINESVHGEVDPRVDEQGVNVKRKEFFIAFDRRRVAQMTSQSQITERTDQTVQTRIQLGEGSEKISSIEILENISDQFIGQIFKAGWNFFHQTNDERQRSRKLERMGRVRDSKEISLSIGLMPRIEIDCQLFDNRMEKVRCREKMQREGERFEMLGQNRDEPVELQKIVARVGQTRLTPNDQSAKKRKKTKETFEDRSIRWPLLQRQRQTFQRAVRREFARRSIELFHREIQLVKIRRRTENGHVNRRVT